MCTSKGSASGGSQHRRRQHAESGPGKVHSKAGGREFLWFKDSQGTRKEYLAEMAEMAYGGQAEDETWGLGMGEQARAAIIVVKNLVSDSL